MLRLSRGQRAILAEKLPDLANLLGGGFVVGEFLDDAPMSLSLFVVAAAAWLGLIGLAMFFARSSEHAE